MKISGRYNTKNTPQHLHSKDNEGFKAVICFSFTAVNTKLQYFAVHMHLL
jgi:hypothetical protein